MTKLNNLLSSVDPFFTKDKTLLSFTNADFTNYETYFNE